MGNTITSANSVFTLGVSGLFPVPQQLQGYAADRAFETEAVELGELVLGVDGVLSAGWTPRITPQTIQLMPDSASIAMFDAWVAAEDSGTEKLPATATITLPSISKKYTLANGFLTSVVRIPNAEKVLRAQTFRISWGSVIVAPSAG